MGRELRMVPPNWEHPKYTEDDAPNYKRVGQYKPMFDEQYTPALNEWLENHYKWERGEHEDQKNPETKLKYRHYAQWSGNPPDVEFYRPYEDSEATWFQAYQTVSEGTPVSPPFATKEELVNYLVDNGDFWDQERGRGRKYSREAAEYLVNGGYAPSFAIINGKGYEGAEIATVPLNETHP